MATTNTIYQMIGDFALDTFAMIYDKATDDMSEDEYDEMCAEIKHECADTYVIDCDNIQDFILQYGMYVSIQMYNYNYDMADLAGISEKEFYGKLLSVILTNSDEAINLLSYDRYKEFVKHQN